MLQPPGHETIEMHDLKLFVFDLAGTSVQDDGVVLSGFLEVAARHGLPEDADWIRARMGWDKATVFAALVDRGDAPRSAAAVDPDALAVEFQEVLARRYRESPPQPTNGFEGTLARLDEAGVDVAFTTGFARATADLILDALGWGARISVASDEVDQGRPAPDLVLEAMRRAGVERADEVGVAGDTPSDLAAGTAAGAAVVVGVGSGTHTLDELAGHPHTHLMDDLSMLVDELGLPARRP